LGDSLDPRGIVENGKRYESPLKVLQHILQCGYLKPSFASRSPRFGGDSRHTIHGSYPAVCFTDQPLSSFIQSCKALSSRYQEYALAFEKQNLFSYGGRPVIYGDKNLLARLHDDDKYLWVRYDPFPTDMLPSSSSYPIDWTHEREWRTRTRKYAYREWGLTPEEGVPLILPPVFVEGEWVIPLPIVLVRTSQEATQLSEFLAGLQYNGANGFIRKLYDCFSEVKITPIDVVSERLKAGDSRWARFETLPWEEIP